MMRPLVVMGVSAAGKSTVGRGLARELDLRFVDADDLHPSRNRHKMASGRPLTDEDRWPWLDLVGAEIARDTRVVVACSALRRRYRDRLRLCATDLAFIHLHAPTPVLESRARSREDHFMPPSLLSSQLATLEKLADDERGVTIDVSVDAAEVIATATEWARTHD